MKKSIMGVLVFLILSGVLFSQSIDRSLYIDIDPFDYELQSKQALVGSTRKYKSTVRFSTQTGTLFFFNSLDGGTTLIVNASNRFDQMINNQKVTIYYTATKYYVDSLVLDDIDYNNLTAGPSADFNFTQNYFPSFVDRSQYREIDPYNFELESKQTPNGSVRKYKSTVTFALQTGTTFFFNSLYGSTTLMVEATRRLNQMVQGQRVTIYYTAIKNYVDNLVLDDIEY